jgi:rod shape-determining protein MreC
MRNTKDPSERKNKYTLIILTVVCVCMILLGVSEAFPVKAVKNIAGTILSPIQTGISKAGTWVNTQQTDIKNVQELTEANQELQDQVDYLEEENTRLTENQQELEELRELYDMDGDYSSYDKVAAKVISKDPGTYYDYFTINKGSSSGIEEGMNVIADGGLAGLVTEVGTNWSRVRSIIDDESRISATVLNTSDNCIISGDLELISEGKLRLTELQADAEVSSGEKVVTSDISDRYLPGLLIGYIDTVEEDTNNLTKTGYLIPAVDFTQISDVFVILATKDIGDTSGSTLTPETSEGTENVSANSGS